MVTSTPEAMLTYMDSWVYVGIRATHVNGRTIDNRFYFYMGNLVRNACQQIAEFEIDKETPE